MGPNVPRAAEALRASMSANDMTLYVANKKVVCRPGTMVDEDLVPPEDLGLDEIWHMTAWTELAQKFLILRGSMLRETFPLFMTLVESEAKEIRCADYAELGRTVFRQLLKLDFNAFARGLANVKQPVRDVLELRALNPNAWKLFDGVLTAPMALSLDTPPAFRRLDAMARVFHALLDKKSFKPACVVVFAVPGPKRVKFLIGCNNPPNQRNVQKMLATELFNSPWLTTDVEPEVILALEMGIDLLNVLPKDDCEKLRMSRVQRDHKKVLTWLTDDLKIRDVNDFAQCLEFVPTFFPRQPIHGDMAALIWLLTEENCPLDPKHALEPLPCSSKLKEGGEHPSWSILPTGHPFEGECYMGDSYLCCPYCAYVVSQYNIWAKTKGLLRIGARGYHTADQGGWRFVFKPEQLKVLKGRRLDRLESFIQFLSPLCDAMKLDREEHIKRQVEKERENQKEKEIVQSDRGQKTNEPQSEVLIRTLKEGLESAFGAPPTIGFGAKFHQTISLRPSRSRSPSPVRRDRVDNEENFDENF
jgi:hypothetical protein